MSAASIDLLEDAAPAAMITTNPAGTLGLPASDDADMSDTNAHDASKHDEPAALANQMEMALPPEEEEPNDEGTPALPPDGAKRARKEKPVAMPAAPEGLTGDARTIYDKLMEAGYEPVDALAFAMEQQKDSTDAPLVYALEQTERFSARIFEESFSESLEARVGTVLKKKSLDENATVGLYRQYDVNGTKHTILTIEFADADSAALFKGGQFKHEDISFNVVELSAWLASIADSIKNVGKRYAAVFGPWPFMPTFDTVEQYKGLLTSTYGDITNVTIYKDRTITIGFAQGNRPTPTKRKPLAVMRNGTFMGTLNPIHNIRMLGLDNCLTCCGIGAFHGAECEANKKNFALHMKKKKKLNAQNGARARGDKEEGEWERVKATRRGGRGSGRAGAEPVAKKSWADQVGA